MDSSKQAGIKGNPKKNLLASDDSINSKDNQSKSEDPPCNSEGPSSHSEDPSPSSHSEDPGPSSHSEDPGPSSHSEDPGPSSHSEDPPHTSGPSQPDDSSKKTSWLKTILPIGAAAVVAGGGAIIAAPIVISAVGFGAGGIAAGSLAASMMSSAATTGVGMGVVSALQSAGAAGIALSTNGLIAVTGASVGGGVTKFMLWATGRKAKTENTPSEGEEEPARDEKPCGQEVGVNTDNTFEDTDRVIIRSYVGIQETGNIDDTVEPSDPVELTSTCVSKYVQTD